MPLAERAALRGEIAYIAERDGNKEVYVVRPDGAGERRLTDTPADEYTGPASPVGGALLVTTAEGDGPTRVERFAVLPVGGGPARPLGPPGALRRNPSWSPDGAYVVFESNTRDGFRDLYRADRGAREIRQLTDNPEGNFAPAVSPDGRWIAFVSSRDSVAELYRVRPDGSVPERLTQTRRDEMVPTWASDAGLLAFASDRDGSDRIYLSYPDGREVRRLTREATDPFVVEERPTWSPVGHRIAWVHRELRGRTTLRLADLQTGARGEIRLPADSGRPGEPVWSPDAGHLAFTVTRGGGDIQVWIARADGTGATQITRAAGPNWNPVWVGPGR